MEKNLENFSNNELHNWQVVERIMSQLPHGKIKAARRKINLKENFFRTCF